MSSGNKYISTKNCIYRLDNLIKELSETRSFLLHNKFENAEHELIDALSEIANAINCVNYLKNKKEVVK